VGLAPLGDDYTMDVSLLLAAGVLFSVFVGVNIGGSSTAAAFGPSVGSQMVTKSLAALLMTAFAFVGAWTVGRHVVQTLSEGIVPAQTLTLQAGVVVLLFVGVSLLVANAVGIPASTSEKTVGAIVGLGLATNTLQTAKVSAIAAWWVVSPVLALVVAGLVGRFAYAKLERILLDGERIEGPVLAVDRDGLIPRIERSADLTTRHAVVVGLTVLVGCYMAFSAGASNVANAVAPLVGEGSLGVSTTIVLATGAIGLGAFTIARRTLEVVGNDLAQLPLVAALVVELVAASFITFLSALGIPASLAITTTCSIVGLNLGRTRYRSHADAPAAVAADGGERDDEELLDTEPTWRSVGIWVLTPILSAGATFVVFSFLPT
jgi:PiT family inorganic phosphate transporter